VALGSAEGYKSRLDSIGPDPLEPSMKLVSIPLCHRHLCLRGIADDQTSLGSKVPWIIHKLIEYIAEYIQGDKTFAEIFGQYSSSSSAYYAKMRLIC
jgi:hypothetical protein